MQSIQSGILHFGSFAFGFVFILRHNLEMQLFHDFSYEPNVAQEEESKQEKQI